MTIVTRGSSFQVSVGSGKDRVRVTCKTLAEAQAKEADLLADMATAKLKALQAAQRGDTTKTLQDCYDLAYKHVWAGSKGERTTVLNAKDMLALLGPDTPVPAIDADAVEEAVERLEERGLTGATINRKLAVVGVMMKQAVLARWVPDRPLMRRRKEAKGRIHFYTHAEERAMVEACQYLGLPGLADFISFGISTGFRRSEMLSLSVEDCRNGVIELADTKNGTPRAQPITDLTRAIIQKAIDGGHKRVFFSLSEATLRAQWDAMCDYLGAENNPKYIVHVLRHTTATRLALAGASAAQVMAFMGHKAIQTSMRYIHLNTDHLVGVAALLARPEAPRPALRVVA